MSMSQPSFSNTTNINNGNNASLLGTQSPSCSDTFFLICCNRTPSDGFQFQAGAPRSHSVPSLDGKHRGMLSGRLSSKSGGLGSASRVAPSALSSTTASMRGASIISTTSDAHTPVRPAELEAPTLQLTSPRRDAIAAATAAAAAASASAASAAAASSRAPTPTTSTPAIPATTTPAAASISAAAAATPAVPQTGLDMSGSARLRLDSGSEQLRLDNSPRPASSTAVAAAAAASVSPSAEGGDVELVTRFVPITSVSASASFTTSAANAAAATAATAAAAGAAGGTAPRSASPAPPVSPLAVRPASRTSSVLTLSPRPVSALAPVLEAPAVTSARASVGASIRGSPPPPAPSAGAGSAAGAAGGGSIRGASVRGGASPGPGAASPAAAVAEAVAADEHPAISAAALAAAGGVDILAVLRPISSRGAARSNEAAAAAAVQAASSVAGGSDAGTRQDAGSLALPAGPAASSAGAAPSADAGLDALAAAIVVAAAAAAATTVPAVAAAARVFPGSAEVVVPVGVVSAAAVAADAAALVVAAASVAATIEPAAGGSPAAPLASTATPPAAAAAAATAPAEVATAASPPTPSGPAPTAEAGTAVSSPTLPVAAAAAQARLTVSHVVSAAAEAAAAAALVAAAAAAAGTDSSAGVDSSAPVPPLALQLLHIPARDSNWTSSPGPASPGTSPRRLGGHASPAAHPASPPGSPGGSQAGGRPGSPHALPHLSPRSSVRERTPLGTSPSGRRSSVADLKGPGGGGMSTTPSMRRSSVTLLSGSPSGSDLGGQTSFRATASRQGTRMAKPISVHYPKGEELVVPRKDEMAYGFNGTGLVAVGADMKGAAVLAPSRLRIVVERDEVRAKQVRSAESARPSEAQVAVRDPEGLYSARSPFWAPITAARYETASWSDRKVLHVEFGLGDSGIAYQPGDALGLLPANSSDVVANVLKRLGRSGTEVVTLAASSKDVELEPHLTSPASLSHLFTQCVDLTSAPKKSLLRMLAEHCSDASEKRTLTFLTSRAGKDAYAHEILEHQPSLLDLLLRFESCRPPLDALLDALPAMQPRLYSLASAPEACPGKAQVALSVVRFRTRYGGRQGACSGWLDRIAAPFAQLDEAPASLPLVALFLKRGTDFRPPADPLSPAIMIGPGTGVAPFRGFLQRRRAQLAALPAPTADARGDWLLLCGCRREDEDYLYRAELEAFKADGTLAGLDVAFSRTQADKVYVQHLVRQQAVRVADLIVRQGASVFVCGDGGGMARDVHAALRDVLQGHFGAAAGGAPGDEAATAAAAAEADALLTAMAADHRYVQDVWS